MGEQVHGEPALRAHHAERVDQERHVVGDDHDDGVRGGEAVARRLRVEHAHQRLAARPRTRPRRSCGERRAGEVLGRALHEIELGDAVVEVAREPVRRDRQPLGGAARRAAAAMRSMMA